MRSRRSLDGVATLPLMSSGTRGVRRPTPSSRSFAQSRSVPGLRLEPQVPVRVAGRTIHPDLVDVDLRIVVEADSHEFHTKRDQITRDCWPLRRARPRRLAGASRLVGAGHAPTGLGPVRPRARSTVSRQSFGRPLPSRGATVRRSRARTRARSEGVRDQRSLAHRHRQGRMLRAQSCSNASSPPTQVCRTCVSRILIGSVLSSSQMSRSTQTTSAS